MTQEEKDDLRQRIDAGIKAGVAEALEEHRRAGRPIVIWKNGKVVVVPPDEIPVRTAPTK
jgi:hypothetical protein